MLFEIATPRNQLRRRVRPARSASPPLCVLRSRRGRSAEDAGVPGFGLRGRPGDALHGLGRSVSLRPPGVPGLARRNEGERRDGGPGVEIGDGRDLGERWGGFGGKNAEISWI